MTTRRSFTILLAFIATFNLNAAVIYVDKDATGANDGSSWTDAYEDLHDALAAALLGDEIWVAEGVYKPTSTMDRNVHFLVDESISIYAGFDGTETMRWQRDWATNSCRLSGQIGNLSDDTDNSYNVLTIDGAEVVVDGFVIERAYLDPTGFGALYGGARLINDADGDFRHCVFRNNTSPSEPALITFTGYVVIDNCLIRDNHTDHGGIVGLENNASGLIVNSTFSQNDHIQTFGAVIAGPNTTTLQIYNSIFWDNDQIQAEGSIPTIADQCLFDVYNDVANDNYTNIITDDPLFVNPGGNDFTLQGGSPAFDAGFDGYSTLNLDRSHNARIWNGAVDLGCYEYYSEGILYVDVDAAGADDGTSWVDGFTDLQSALATYTGTEEIWIAEGTYLPTAGSDQDITFQIPDACKIFGGFQGNESARNQRDPEIHHSILSGEIGDPADDTDNSFHVLTLNNVTNVTLNGIIIEESYAYGGVLNDNGGGIRITDSEIVIANCSISRNRASFAAGILLDGLSVADISNSIFEENEADATACIYVLHDAVANIEGVQFTNNTANNGVSAITAPGELYLTESDFTSNTSGSTGGTVSASGIFSINRCSFQQNEGGLFAAALYVAPAGDGSVIASVFSGNTTDGGGAGVYCTGAAHIENCLFVANDADEGSAVFTTSQGHTDIINCTMAGNTGEGPSSSTIQHEGPTGTMVNCILWGNTTDNQYESTGGAPDPSHCIIQGGGSGTAIYDLNPEFINPAAGNFSFTSTSPAFNSGLITAVTQSLDLQSNDRVQHFYVDLGCVEISDCLQPHDDCAIARILTMEEGAVFGSNFCSTSDLTLLSCGTSNGKSTWYTFEAPPSGNAEIQLTYLLSTGATIDLKMGLFEGICGSLTLLDCANENLQGEGELLDVQGLVPGQEYKIKVEGAGPQSGGWMIQLSESAATCFGDFNFDGLINTSDLLLFLTEFSCMSGCQYDLTGDDQVNTTDLLSFLTIFDTTCQQ